MTGNGGAILALTLKRSVACRRAGWCSGGFCGERDRSLTVDNGETQFSRRWKTSDVISATSATISAASALVAVAVLILGYWQYQSAEKWKRSEFVAAQIKEFTSDNVNRAVLMMMDYDPARIELFPEKGNTADRYVNVTFDMLVSAIEHDHDFPDDAQFKVKIYFERFLTSLSRLNYFLVSGTIQATELCADFSYPVELMTGTAREMKLKNSGVDIAPFSKAVQAYLARWKYDYIMTFQEKIQKACN